MVDFWEIASNKIRNSRTIAPCLLSRRLSNSCKVWPDRRNAYEGPICWKTHAVAILSLPATVILFQSLFGRYRAQIDALQAWGWCFAKFEEYWRMDTQLVISRNCEPMPTAQWIHRKGGVSACEESRNNFKYGGTRGQAYSRKRDGALGLFWGNFRKRQVWP